MRMRIVTFERKIFVTQREQILGLGIHPQRRQRPRLAGQLQPRLFEMIEIKMRVAKTMDESSWLESGDLRDRHRQQRVRSNVEWHAEEDVGGALIELA